MTSRTIRSALTSWRTLTLAIAASTLAAALTAGPVHAQTPDRDGVPALTVNFADLDLSRPAGARILYRRMVQAAAVVCGGKPDPRLLQAREAFNQCVNDSIDRALRQVDAPLVTAAAGRAAPTRLAAHR